MNYGKDHLSQLKTDDPGTKVSRKIGFTLLRTILIGLLALAILVGFAGYGAVMGLIRSAPDISTLSVTPSESATYIYNGDGSVMQKLSLATSNRTIVTIDQIPLDLQHAVVAIEDERFYTHKGIDIRGIIRAGVVGITTGNFSEGASTITQQLLKNNVFTDWMNETSLIDKFKRKFQEQYLALELEKVLSKDQILQDYLNTINLGAGAYGVQAAAHRYFNKDVSELNLSECAVIAGITQNPTRYNPITNPEDNAQRRETVLKKMLEQEYITQEAYDQAIQDDVYSRIQSTESETGQTSVYTYYVDATIDQVIEDLMEQKGYTEQQANKLLFTSGLKIHTAQDASIQSICDEEFLNPNNFPGGTEVGLDYALSVQYENGDVVHYGNEDFKTFYQQNYDANFNMMFPDTETANAGLAAFKASKAGARDTVLGERIVLTPQPQASLTVIDQATGYVKAIVGGRGKKDASLTLNRATTSTRQPGSSFKILTTYAPALDYDNMTLATVYNNAPYAYRDGTPVNNWDSYNTYTGYTTIREAITDSINVVAVKCITDITPEIGFQYAEKFGISTLHNDTALDVSQPLALGGITDGVTNLELTGAFAAIANGGSYIEPKFYTYIEDANGEVILDNREPVESRVIDEKTAFLLTDAMKDVVTEGTGTLIDLGGMPVAGKTGTTDDYKDIWFAGYTPYYTCAVWGGYDNNAELPSIDGDTYHTYHKILWSSIMTRIHNELEIRDFEMPEGIVSATVCKKSGKLAVSGVCDSDPRGNMVYEEYFAHGTEPSSSCDNHLSVPVCQETGLLPTSTCQTVNRVFIRQPDDSYDYTEDTDYAPPTQTCAGHRPQTVLDNLLDPSGQSEAETPQTESERRAEEDAAAPSTEGGNTIPPATGDTSHPEAPPDSGEIQIIIN